MQSLDRLEDFLAWCREHAHEPDILVTVSPAMVLELAEGAYATEDDDAE